MLKILLADDHPMFRKAMLFAIRELFPVAATVEVSNHSTLEAAIDDDDFDLALLDLMMPGAHGFSSLVYLRSERPELPVIVVSSNEAPNVSLRAREFGAAAFVPKSSPIDLVSMAIHRVLEGGTWFPEQHLGRSTKDAALADKLTSLTPQQLRVVIRVADGQLNKQIALDLGLSENTVKMHLSAALKKLGCYTRTQAAVLLKSLEVENGNASLGASSKP